MAFSAPAISQESPFSISVGQKTMYTDMKVFDIRDPLAFQKGDRVKAFWYDDGQWHSATIDTPPDGLYGTCRVIWESDGSVTDLKIQDIREEDVP